MRRAIFDAIPPITLFDDVGLCTELWLLSREFSGTLFSLFAFAFRGVDVSRVNMSWLNLLNEDLEGSTGREVAFLGTWSLDALLKDQNRCLRALIF